MTKRVFLAAAVLALAGAPMALAHGTGTHGAKQDGHAAHSTHGTTEHGSVAAHTEQHGAAARVGDLEIAGAWVRGTPPGSAVSAAYLTVTNTGDAVDRLVGGTSPIASMVEIHDMTMQNGVMSMFEIEGGLPIAPGETVVLQPGGKHVMLMGLKGQIMPDETVALTLEFQDAGAVTLNMPTSAIGAQSLGAGGS